MPEDYIEDQERLYRAIKLFPNWWKFETNRPSSAAFKDSRGVSVDRQGNRKPDDIIDKFKIKFDLRAIVSLTAKQCRDSDTHPVPKPEPDNPDHGEIHGSPTEVTLTSGKARRLSKSVRIDYVTSNLPSKY